MILFEEDWDLYPAAIIDEETKNRSFVRLAALYRDMGIKNHNFILQLHDPSLQGVDPFDPDLSMEMKGKITLECKYNFWYWIREIANDPAGGKDNRIWFEANRGIVAAYWLYFCHITYMLIMIRQTGKSFGLSWLDIWLENVGTTYYDISCLVPNEKLAAREIERQKGMENALPPYLKMRSVKDPGNTEVFKISAMNNTFKTFVSNKSPVIADQIGRGMTTGTVRADEFAYAFNNFITVPVMLSASLAARELAAAKLEPYGVIFSTTSGKRDTPHGGYAYRMMMESATFMESMFDCRNLLALKKVVSANSKSPDRPRVNCTLNHRQLGKDDEWLKQRISDSEQDDPVQIAADFFNEWPLGSSDTPFTPAELKTMKGSETAPTFSDIAKPEPYVLNWYYPENEVKRRMAVEPHILGADPSEASGGDSFSYTLTNAYSGEVVMRADVSQGNIWALAEFTATFMRDYPKVILIPERRSMGAAVCDYVVPFLARYGIDPFTHIYNQVVQNKAEFPQRFEDILNGRGLDERTQTDYKKFFGYPTSSTGNHSRSAIYSDALRVAIRMGAPVMRDRTLILQTVGLEKRDGRIDHAKGQHDDATVSWLLTYWLLAHGRNLDYYGIDASKILTRNQTYQSQVQEMSHYERSKLEKARRDVERLTKQLELEKDEYVARRLEYDLETAISNLSEKDRQVVSADDLIKRLREARTKTQGGYLDYLRQFQ